MRERRKYLIAVKDDRKENAPSDLAATVNKIGGLNLCGLQSGTRVMVEATDAAISEVKNLLSDVCHIQAPISHKPS